MSGGARRAAARSRVHNAAAGRIRIGVAIVAGGAFGALVVLWGGLGPSTDADGRTPSANERPCNASAGCLPSTLPPLLTPGANGSGSPSSPAVSPPPRTRRPLPTGAPGAPGAPTSGMPTPEVTMSSTPDPTEPTDPSMSPSDPDDPAPTGPDEAPIGVIVDVPPIVLPSCILAC